MSRAPESHWSTKEVKDPLFPVPYQGNKGFDTAKSLGMKRDLKVSVELDMARHWEKCPGPGPILLGTADEFDLSSAAEFNIFVQNNEIYLFISCPGGQHENLGSMIQRVLTTSIREATKMTLTVEYGSADQPVINELGCHSHFNKQPDGSICVRRDLAGSQRYPVIVVEVASMHESLHLLFCEASTWLNSHTDVVYVIIVKIWPRDPQKNTRMEIFFLERKDLSSEGSSTVTTGKRETSASRHCCPVNDDPFFQSSVDIQEFYKLSIIRRFILEGVPTSEIEIKIDLHKLFRDTDIDLTQIPHFVSVYFTKELELYYVEFPPQNA